MDTFARKLSEALESIRDHDISYRVYNVEANSERWFTDYSQVIEFLSSASPEDNDGHYGSIAPYAVGKKSNIFGVSTQAFEAPGDSISRWAFEGETLSNILWHIKDGMVSIWIEDILGDLEPLTKYIQKYGKKYSREPDAYVLEIKLSGNATSLDWGEEVIPMTTKIAIKKDLDT